GIKKVDPTTSYPVSILFSKFLLALKRVLY
ncbi:unnamed protein product, partial [marine sediment metagenome]